MMIHIWGIRLCSFVLKGVILVGSLINLMACGSVPKITGFEIIPPGAFVEYPNSMYSVEANSTISIEVKVEPGGPIISNYRWSLANGGQGKIEESCQGKPMITYTAPENPGKYKVNILLQYEGGNVKDFIIIEVKPPVIETITPTTEPSQTPSPTCTSSAIPTDTLTPTETPDAAASKTAEADESATAAAKATAIAQTATAETNQTAIATAQTATAEAAATATAKALIPTATPTPKFDAIVIAPNGVALRKGPKDDYDLIDTLSQGTPLNNLRPVVGNKDWIKVSVDLGADKPTEGYVTTTSSFVQINVQLDDFPPIYEYGPALSEPKWGETRSIGEPITFKWQEDYAILEEYQFYSHILVLDGHPLGDEGACYHWQTKDTIVAIKPEDYGCTKGEYHWGVGIATDLSKGQGDKRIWRDDSEKDERIPIGLDVPHPEKPPEEGRVRGSGGGSGSSAEGEFDQ